MLRRIVDVELRTIGVAAWFLVDRGFQRCRRYRHPWAYDVTADRAAQRESEDPADVPGRLEDYSRAVIGTDAVENHSRMCGQPAEVDAGCTERPLLKGRRLGPIILDRRQTHERRSANGGDGDGKDRSPTALTRR